MHDVYLQVQCLKLQSKILSMETIEIKNLTRFTEDLKRLLRCPPRYNYTLQELERVRLHACCNATGTLYLTKQNTPLNHSISYETNSRVKRRVDSDLYAMLPEEFPWSGGNLRRCAVVGSGGILKNSSCGEEINNSDFVIRFNLAPVNDSDVGVKTDLITINPSQIRRDYKNFKKDPGPLLQDLSVYGNASVLMPAFSYTYNTAISVSIHETLWPQQVVVFFSPFYLKTLAQFWSWRGLKAVRLSTGFMLINVAMELCDDVHIYGFWPFDINLDQQPIFHHYFDNAAPKKGVHKMPEEFLRLLQLHSQGVLTMHLQPCL
ncbi:alpha-2,8-sialyltransferase 8F-like [Chanos chanos]|uniref:Alpha-2,8-sialyltransferase 8F-like n=1 Tax=Chanos chanos TaxID=29144 RepID=A0A6J2VFY0_CHACN|nr:alpha-2,8-sialyltransferase 8F-like [Chanos chanos]